MDQCTSSPPSSNCAPLPPVHKRRWTDNSKTLAPQDPSLHARKKKRARNLSVPAAPLGSSTRNPGLEPDGTPRFWFVGLHLYRWWINSNVFSQKDVLWERLSKI